MLIANEKTRSSIAALTIGLLFLFALGACSIVPDWSEQEFRDYRITAHYEGGAEPRTVPLPSSTKHLLILELDLQLSALREIYRDSSRLLMLPAGGEPMCLECRYRLFRQHAPDGTPLPWPEPHELFPGTNHIDHHN